MSQVPELRAALVRAAERQAAAARPRAPWRGHLGGLGIALAGAVAIAVVAVVIAVGGSGPGTPSGVPASSANLLPRARQAAQVILRQSRILGAEERLTNPSVGVSLGALGATQDGLQADHLVDMHTFYVVHVGLQRATDMFSRSIERPTGTAESGSAWVEGAGSSTSGGSGGRKRSLSVEWRTTTFNLPPSGPILRALVVQVAAARGGGTAVRIDAEAGWDSPRPAWSRIAPGVQRIDAWLSGPPGRSAPGYRRTIRGSQARSVVAWLNGLGQSPASGINGCSPRAGNYAELSIEGTHGSLGHATVSLACGSVSLAVAGRPSIGLLWTASRLSDLRRTAQLLEIISGYSYLQVGPQTSGQSSGSATSSTASASIRSG